MDVLFIVCTLICILLLTLKERMFPVYGTRLICTDLDGFYNDWCSRHNVNQETMTGDTFWIPESDTDIGISQKRLSSPSWDLNSTCICAQQLANHGSSQIMSWINIAVPIAVIAFVVICIIVQFCSDETDKRQGNATGERSPMMTQKEFQKSSPHSMHRVPAWTPTVNRQSQTVGASGNTWTTVTQKKNRSAYVSQDGDDYRKQAKYHHDQRQMYFEKASQAYSRGQGAMAKELSTKGHMHTKLMEEANTRAANQIYRCRNVIAGNSTTIDLHGLHVKEAEARLHSFIQDKKRNNRVSRITVVSGRGRHSTDGVCKLRHVAMDYFWRNSYKFTETDHGTFNVQLSSHHFDGRFKKKDKL